MMNFNVNPFVWLLSKYKSLVIKTSNDFLTNLIATTNYELVHDVEIYKLLPMLEVVQNLNKLAQNIDCFICDSIIVVKFIQVNFYNIYVDHERHFSHDQFQSFLVRLKSNALPIVWYSESITQMDYVAFHFKEKFYMLHKTNKCN